MPLPDEPVSFETDPSARLASEPYRLAVEGYMKAEVVPYVPDASVDHAKTKIGYEIPLTRHFHTYVPPRPLEQIDAEIRSLEEEIQELLGEVAK
jgi:type I restriction enzyme M protein